VPAATRAPLDFGDTYLGHPPEGFAGPVEIVEIDGFAVIRLVRRLHQECDIVMGNEEVRIGAVKHNYPDLFICSRILRQTEKLGCHLNGEEIDGRVVYCDKQDTP